METNKPDSLTTLMLLGIIAILAIVGVVLMFTKAGASGYLVSGAYQAPKVYGGALKALPSTDVQYGGVATSEQLVEYPYYADRGRPAVDFVIPTDYPFPEVKVPDISENRVPTHIASEMTGCPGGISAGQLTTQSLQSTGKWQCVPTPGVSGGNCCYMQRAT